MNNTIDQQGSTSSTLNDSNTYSSSSIYDSVVKSYVLWSEQEKQFLFEAIQLLYHDKPIKWKQMEKYFPGRTKLQIKSYYHNSVKLSQDIANKICSQQQSEWGIQTDEEQQFIIDYFASGYDFDTLCKRLSNMDPKVLKIRFNALQQIFDDVFAASPFVLAYPETSFDFTIDRILKFEGLVLFLQNNREKLLQALNDSETSQELRSKMYIQSLEKLARYQAQAQIIKKDLFLQYKITVKTANE